MKKYELKKLFSGMCCSVCGHDFDENAIFVKREEKHLLVLQIICPECGKNFGLALLGARPSPKENPEDESLEFQDCPMPISYDDVLDAHNFIDSLEKDWSRHIPSELKKNI